MIQGKSREQRAKSRGQLFLLSPQPSALSPNFNGVKVR